MDFFLNNIFVWHFYAFSKFEWLVLFQNWENMLRIVKDITFLKNKAEVATENDIDIANIAEDLFDSMEV